MTGLYFDDRWCAPHGIGRFATEVRKRLRGFSDLPICGSPTSPSDALRLAHCLGRRSANGFFSPGFNVPAWARCPVISTIHDLIHIHFAGERSLAKTAYYRFVQRPIVRRSPVTLTVSEFSRRQIVQWYGVPESRVACVGNGVSSEFTASGDAYQSQRPYFLYVGNNKPHKNVTALLHSMVDPIVDADTMLIMVCKSDRGLRKTVRDLGLEDRVRTITGIDDVELAKLYRAAIALVLPSHYEGFGLPLVEAMSCGCPVIASNCTSIPEVLDGAGLLFDPSDHNELARHMADLIREPGSRDPLRQKGLQRASAFTWDAVAARVHDAIAPHLAA